MVHRGTATQPFQAHAWVAVDGVPIGEEASTYIRYFHRTMTVRPSRS